MSQPEAPEPQRWDLGRRGGVLELTDDGVDFSLKRRKRQTHVPYTDLTHVDTSDRGLWLATRHTTVLLRRTLFERDEDPEEFVRALGARLQHVDGGIEVIDRMLAVAARIRTASSRRATSLVVFLCFAVFAVQFPLPLAMEVGSFVPALVVEGEFWRIATGNFLHGFSALPVHLLINVMCLFAFGMLVERPLGSIRTFVIMAVGALGAMLGSAIAGYQEVVGASGMVAALGGAVVWLEFNAAEHLAAWWRLPRRLFIGVLLLQALADMALPFVAGGAHLGGFVAGYLVARWVGPGAIAGRPPSVRLQQLAGVFALLTLVSFTSAGQLLFREGAVLESHAQRLLKVADTEAMRLNDLAWRMVTEFEPTETQLGLAIQLATKAVEETEFSDPDYLDTLAEVLFIAGQRDAAVEVIDQAILLNLSEDYFRQQRRRFTGERDPEDRPAPPRLPWSFRKRLEDQLLGPEPGASI